MLLELDLHDDDECNWNGINYYWTVKATLLAITENGFGKRTELR